jgi:hypothetical protein
MEIIIRIARKIDSKTDPVREFMAAINRKPLSSANKKSNIDIDTSESNLFLRILKTIECS